MAPPPWSGGGAAQPAAAMMMQRGPAVMRKTRTKVTAGRVTGKIVEWKGSFGWIQPDTKVNHPEAAMNRGKIYLSEKDIETEISDVGAAVSFTVYADGTGLGAAECRPVGQGAGVAKTILKKSVSQDARALGATVDPVRGKRERISDEPVRGTIKMWKATFGWVSPSEPIAHPLFKGEVYLAAKDTDNPEGMLPGVEVQFYVYADSQGLGAENCTAWTDSVIPSEVPKGPTASVASIGGSGIGGAVLKAKPKGMASIPTGTDPELAARLNAWMWDRGG